MRTTATDAARSVVCVLVCLYMCWSHGCAVQKRQNRSRCRLEERVTHVDPVSHVWGPDHLVQRAWVRRRRCGLLADYCGELLYCCSSCCCYKRCFIVADRQDEYLGHSVPTTYNTRSRAAPSMTSVTVTSSRGSSSSSSSSSCIAGSRVIR